MQRSSPCFSPARLSSPLVGGCRAENRVRIRTNARSVSSSRDRNQLGKQPLVFVGAENHSRSHWRGRGRLAKNRVRIRTRLSSCEPSLRANSARKLVSERHWFEFELCFQAWRAPATGKRGALAIQHSSSSLRRVPAACRRRSVTDFVRLIQGDARPGLATDPCKDPPGRTWSLARPWRSRWRPRSRCAMRSCTGASVRS